MSLPLIIGGFAGLAPRTYKRLLKDNEAQVATNCRLTNGQIQALRDPLEIYNPSIGTVASFFRMVGDQGERWLTWGVDVDVARGAVFGDTAQRVYWMGDYEPRMSTYADATNGGGPYPDTFYVLGVFPPDTALSASPSGGTGADSTRVYTYTFVTPLGEESQPAPPSTAQTGKDNGTWSLSAMDTAPANTFTVTGASWAAGVATYTVASTFGLRVGEEVDITGITPAGYNVRGPITEVSATTIKLAVASNPGAWSSGGTIARISLHNTTGMTKRIYRTITAASGATEYRFVDEIAVANTTYSDTILDSVVATKEKLPSTEWAMPTVGARGIIIMPNGIAVAFDGKEIMLSEPFQPHAWPTRYRQTANHNIVAVGYFGTTVVVATDGVPYWIQGVDPVTMGGGMEGLKVAWPCLSKRSLVSTSFGVMWAAPQGLALIGMSGAEIVTREFFTIEEWRKDFNPSSMVAAIYDNRYFAHFVDGNGQDFCLSIDKSEFAAVTKANFRFSELWTDDLTGKLYVANADSNIISEWDSPSSPRSLFDWMSKEFVMPEPFNYGAAKVDADFAMSEADQDAAAAAIAAAEVANQAIIDAGMARGAPSRHPTGMVSCGGCYLRPTPDATYDSLTFQLYTDGVLRSSVQVKNTRPFRLTAGYKSDNVTVRVSGNVPVTAIKVGQSMTQLKQV